MARATSALSTVACDAWIVMPDHVHGVLWLQPNSLEGAVSLSAVVGAYKSIVATRWLTHLKAAHTGKHGRIWQRSFHDRIIRSEGELNRIRTYIEDNPRRWQEKRENLDELFKHM
ncbi:MAG: transposase [Roseiflexaceae bacterium]|nr:transposase [Roseiflexaceae bacterium]